MYERKLPTQLDKNSLSRFVDGFIETKIIKAVVLLDDYDGLSNGDNCQVNSLDEAIEIIDSGFGIIEIAG